jgi:hypothetical protein
MNRPALILCLLAALSGAAAGSAQAECYADYKAKQDAPLRLHYGVAEVSACDTGTAEAELASRLDAEGWTLLHVLSTFGPEGLGERRTSAGEFYLRY